MATVNETRVKRLMNGGMARLAALDVAAFDTPRDAVADPAAITSAAIASANATSPADEDYTEADQTALADLANEAKATLNTARTDVAAIRTTLVALLASLDPNALSVADPAAMTSVAVTAPDATSPANAVYTQADQTALATLINSIKTQANALRTDVAAVRTTEAALLASLRTYGYIAE